VRFNGLSQQADKAICSGKAADYCAPGNNPLLRAGYVAHQHCAVMLTVTQIKF